MGTLKSIFTILGIASISGVYGKRDCCAEYMNCMAKHEEFDINNNDGRGFCITYWAPCDFEEFNMNGESTIPFSIEDAAAVLEIKPDEIRKIIKDSGHYKITFKPGVAHKWNSYQHMKNMETKLQENNVECLYLHTHNTITIYSDGISDFLKFINKQREKQHVLQLPNPRYA